MELEGDTFTYVEQFTFRVRRSLKLSHFNLIITLFALLASNTSSASNLCSQVLSSNLQLRLSQVDLDNKIQDLTTSKILWDQRDTGNLSLVEQSIASFYPAREREFLAATGISQIELYQKIRQETSKRLWRREELANDEKKKREVETKSIDPISATGKPIFYNIRTTPFIMDSQGQKNKTELSPFTILATPVTQMMYARLMIAIGETDLKIINPSVYVDGPNSISMDINGIKFKMRPNNPVENITKWDISKKLIPKLNQLSDIEDETVQEILKEIIPDHQQGDHYDLPTEAQVEYLMKTATTDDGDTVDAMIMRSDLEKLSIYATINEGENRPNLGTREVMFKLPVYIEQYPLYLYTGIREWVKDVFQDQLQGGKDPIETKGYMHSVRGGSFLAPITFFLSSYRTYGWPDKSDHITGFRLVRIRVSKTEISNSPSQMPLPVSKPQSVLKRLFSKLRGYKSPFK
jgi:formylglycine-generating enzyme required for sulfatase activity